MKKGIVFILAILYITLTSGIVINVHYCMGRLTDVTYGHEKDKACDRCGMEQKPGCCETDHQLIKADTDHLAASVLTAPLIQKDILTTVFPINQLVVYAASQEIPFQQYHSPPDQRGNSLSLFNSVFRL